MEETLHRDLYLESSWFAKERENIFFDQWFCVGREDDVAATGSYRVVDLAGESSLLVRGEDDQVRAFYNLCRHRGWLDNRVPGCRKLYAPMEDLSLDIRNYIATRLDTTLPSE